MIIIDVHLLLFQGTPGEQGSQVKHCFFIHFFLKIKLLSKIWCKLLINYISSKIITPAYALFRGPKPLKIAMSLIARITTIVLLNALYFLKQLLFKKNQLIDIYIIAAGWEKIVVGADFIVLVYHWYNLIKLMK